MARPRIPLHAATRTRAAAEHAPRLVVGQAGAVLGLAWACGRALGFLVCGATRRRRRRRLRQLSRRPGGGPHPGSRSCPVNTDAVPGAVNGLLGRFAAANAVAFDGTDLPRAHVTGTPVRPELASLDRTPGGQAHSREVLGLPGDRETVGAVGGRWARGDQSRRVRPRSGLEAPGGVRCTTSPAGVTTSRSPWPPGPVGNPGAGAGGDPDGLCYRVVPFEDKMPDLYRAADVCVTRAGAMTVAELLVAGVPAILVPLPGAPGTTRRAMPRRWWAWGQPCTSPIPSAPAARLAEELDALLRDPERLAAMGEAARRHAHPTRRPASPNWSTPMPADRAGPGRRLTAPQRVHVVGIGGAGMSAIALVLRAMGHTVSGSDLKDSPVAERLRSHGIAVAVGHRPEHVAGADVLTFSPAVPPENPELVEARAAGSGSPSDPRCWPPSAPPGAVSPSREPTGRRRRPPCCRSSSSKPGCDPPS